ncbi:hypothetical protein ONZ45_g5030 [Pleurotus djamor]|nr:hypothetical protein ONZ45_g5030 [Pleurotus djamor]
MKPATTESDTRCDAKWLTKIQSICASWRDVAMSTPQLWSNIMVSPKSSVLSLATLLLDRSKDVLLSLTIVVIPKESELPETDDKDFIIQKYHQVMVHIFPRIDRVVCLTVFTRYDVVPNGFFDMLPSPTRTPHLRHLVLERQPFSHRSTVPPTLFQTFDTPYLHTLELKQTPLPNDMPFFPHLRRFVLEFSLPSAHNHGLTIPWLFRTLRSLPNLHELEAGFLIPEPVPSPVTGEIVSMKDLKYLSIGFTHIRQFGSFFNFLEISSTISLAVQVDQEDDLQDANDPSLTLHMSPLFDLVSRVCAHHTSAAIRNIFLSLPISFQVDSPSPNERPLLRISFSSKPPQLALHCINLLRLQPP